MSTRFTTTTMGVSAVILMAAIMMPCNAFPTQGDAAAVVPETALNAIPTVEMAEARVTAKTDALKMGEDLKEQIELEGKGAKAPSDNLPTDEEQDEDEDAKAQTDAELKAEAEKEVAASTLFGQNCVTLKAYAIASLDEVEDLEHGAIGVMRPLLRFMATYNTTGVTEATCIKQYSGLITKLISDDALSIQEHDPKAEPENSLTIQELQQLDHAMRGESDQHPIAQGKGRAIEEGCHGKHDQLDCAEMSKKNVGGQWMWVNAMAMGSNSDVPIFRKIAVRHHTLQDAAKEMLKYGLHKKSIVTTLKAGGYTPDVADAAFIRKWQGNF